jgi:hypothetical protein
MLLKRIVTAAAAAFSLSLLANAAMADPVSAAKAGVSPVDPQAPVTTHTPFVLVKGHGGHSGGHGHIGGASNFSRPGMYSRYSKDRDRDRDRRHHRRFRRDFVFFDYYDDYDGSSCYANCRRSHSARYCRTHAAAYCY